MGQKVHPNGFRLGYSKNWNSYWYNSVNSKIYPNLLMEDLKICEYIKGSLKGRRIMSSLIKIYRKCDNTYIMFGTGSSLIKKSNLKLMRYLRNRNFKANILNLNVINKKKIKNRNISINSKKIKTYKFIKSYNSYKKNVYKNKPKNTYKKSHTISKNINPLNVNIKINNNYKFNTPKPSINKNNNVRKYSSYINKDNKENIIKSYKKDNNNTHNKSTIENYNNVNKNNIINNKKKNYINNNTKKYKIYNKFKRKIYKPRNTSRNYLFTIKKSPVPLNYIKFNSNINLITNTNIYSYTYNNYRYKNIPYKNAYYLAKYLAVTFQMHSKAFDHNYIKIINIFQKLKNKTIKGIRISYAGRMWGRNKASTKVFNKGSMPLQNLNELIDYSHVKTKNRFGIVGIKVWLNYYHKNKHRKISKLKPLEGKYFSKWKNKYSYLNYIKYYKYWQSAIKKKSISKQLYLNNKYINENKYFFYKKLQKYKFFYYYLKNYYSNRFIGLPRSHKLKSNRKNIYRLYNKFKHYKFKLLTPILSLKKYRNSKKTSIILMKKLKLKKYNTTKNLTHTKIITNKLKLKYYFIKLKKKKKNHIKINKKHNIKKNKNSFYKSIPLNPTI